MTNSYKDTTLSFEALDEDIVDLSPRQMERAINLSDSDNAQESWDNYLQALAKVGFSQWLEERGRDLDFRETNTLPQTQVEDFTVHLMAMGSLTDTTIPLPKSALDNPAHFYVVVEVMEELGKVKIKSFLTHPDLQECLNSVGNIQDNSTYNLSLAWFDSNSHNLLLYLRCLEPAAIPLSSPSLSLFRLPISPSPHLPVINVGLWLQDRLDELAEELAWVLLPAFGTQASALRSPVAELDELLTQMRGNGADIDSQARGGYYDFQLGDTSLRLYAVTWPFLAPGNLPEWKLLLILSSPWGNRLPDGITIRGRDDNQVLVEQIMDNSKDAPCLYVRLAGSWQETFTIDIIHPGGEAISLPPFAFDPS